MNIIDTDPTWKVIDDVMGECTRRPEDFDDHQLAYAAATYIADAIGVEENDFYEAMVRGEGSSRVVRFAAVFPWESEHHPKSSGHKSKRQKLVCAAALLVTEIERLDKVEAEEKKQKPGA